MHTKVYLLSAFIFFNIFTMEDNGSLDYYDKRKSIHGHTIAHFTSMLSADLKEFGYDKKTQDDASELEKNLQSLDKQRAKVAVGLIDRCFDFTIKDSRNKSPLDYAEKNKDKLPQVHQVMMASQIIQKIAHKIIIDNCSQLLPDEQQLLKDSLNMLDAYKA